MSLVEGGVKFIGQHKRTAATAVSGGAGAVLTGAGAPETIKAVTQTVEHGGDMSYMSSDLRQTIETIPPHARVLGTRAGHFVWNTLNNSGQTIHRVVPFTQHMVHSTPKTASELAVVIGTPLLTLAAANTVASLTGRTGKAQSDLEHGSDDLDDPNKDGLEIRFSRIEPARGTRHSR